MLFMGEEAPRIWATLLLHPLDASGDKKLDPRVTDQPKTLLGGAHGHLNFTKDVLTWSPGFHIHSFHPIEISWSEIWRVQLEFPNFLSAMTRHLYGCMRVFCGRDLIEFAFPFVESKPIEIGLGAHLEPGQIDLVPLLT